MKKSTFQVYINTDDKQVEGGSIGQRVDNNNKTQLTRIGVGSCGPSGPTAGQMAYLPIPLLKGDGKTKKGIEGSYGDISPLSIVYFFYCGFILYRGAEGCG